MGIASIVRKLRKISERLARRPGRVVFPDPGLDVLSFMYFGGDLTFADVAEALHYIADMLEE